MSPTTLVVVANDSVSQNLVKKLCQEIEGIVILSGGECYKKTISDLAQCRYHLVDITSVTSLVELRHYIQEGEDQIDTVIKIASAVEAFPGSVTEQIRSALDINFYGWLNFGKLLHPLVREGGRIITVVSGAGLLAAIPGEVVRSRFSDPKLNEDELVRAVQEYESAAGRGSEKADGWGFRPTDVASVSLSALCDLESRSLKDSQVASTIIHTGEEIGNKWIDEIVGTVSTVMATPSASTFVFLWSDRKSINWRTFTTKP